LGNAAQASFLGKSAQFRNFDLAELLVVFKQSQAVAHNLASVVVAAALDQLLHEAFEARTQGIAARHVGSNIDRPDVSLNIIAGVRRNHRSAGALDLARAYRAVMIKIRPDRFSPAPIPPCQPNRANQSSPNL